MDLTAIARLAAELRWQAQILLSIAAWTPEFWARRLLRRVAARAEVR